MKLQDIAAELIGYKEGCPSGEGLLDVIDVLGIDVCVTSSCASCGHKGMEFHPFVNKELHSYRAFAVCPVCGEAFEF